MLTLVTGATGFIGSHVVDALLAQKGSVRVLVRNPDRASALRNRGVTIVHGDLLDSATLSSACRGVDVIYYCAAATRHRFYHELRQTNLGAVQTILESLRAV